MMTMYMTGRRQTLAQIARAARAARVIMTVRGGRAVMTANHDEARLVMVRAGTVTTVHACDRAAHAAACAAWL